MRKKILIVDDEIELVKCLVELVNLSIENVDIKEAYNGEEALKIMLAEKFDLLITDLNMPKLEGNDLIGKLVNEYPKQYPKEIIVISGHIDLNGKEQSIENVHFVQKPFSMDKMLDLITSLLG